MTDARRIADALVAATRHPLNTALAAAPRAPGVYAWWSTERDIADVTGAEHNGGYLYYVGIANRKSRSLSARLHDHIHKTTRRSTERVTLASLLGLERGWATASVVTRKTPPVRYRTVLADPTDEAALSRWMADHLTVSWVELDNPRDVEKALIADLRPPLNMVGNTQHPSYTVVRAARSAFNDSAARAQ